MTHFLLQIGPTAVTMYTSFPKNRYKSCQSKAMIRYTHTKKKKKKTLVHSSTRHCELKGSKTFIQNDN